MCVYIFICTVRIVVLYRKPVGEHRRVIGMFVLRLFFRLSKSRLITHKSFKFFPFENNRQADGTSVEYRGRDSLKRSDFPRYSRVCRENV